MARPALYDAPLHFMFVLSWVKLFGVVRLPAWLKYVYPGAKARKILKLVDDLWFHAECLVRNKMQGAKEDGGSSVDGPLPGLDLFTVLCEHSS